MPGNSANFFGQIFNITFMVFSGFIGIKKEVVFMVYHSSETQVTKDSDELYALPSSKKKCADKNQLNHIRRLPPNELRDYS